MIRETNDGVTVAVRAQPGAKKTAVTGIYGEGPAAQLKIAVQSPPIDGRANDALIAFLADFFTVPRNRVALVSGDTNRSKVFLIREISTTQARSALSGFLD